MPRLLLATLCDDVRRELAKKNSLMGLFDVFNVGDFTQPVPPFHIFAQLALEEPGIAQVTMRLSSEQGDFKIELPGQLEAREFSQVQGAYICNLDYGIVGLRLPRPGMYEVAFSIAGQPRDFSGPRFEVRAVQPPRLQ